MSEIFKTFIDNEAALKRLLVGYTSDTEAAEDLAQEVFIRAFAAERKAGGKTGIENPRAYLFQVARRLAFERFRRPGPAGSDQGGVDTLLDETQAMADDWLESRRKLALFTRAVASLPEKCREAFLLRHVDGLRYKQIANRMGISVSAVEKHVALGLTRCAEFLASAGYQQADKTSSGDSGAGSISSLTTDREADADQ
ncbi:MAG: RNA polymerase sigma factor [Pseudomonadota bacterium]